MEIEPEHANNNENYAIFLSDIKKDSDEAEKYYLKALELEPEDAYNNGNYAGFLLARGSHEKAKDYLARAWADAIDNVLIIELYFYEYAHVVEKMDEAEKGMIKLLDEGVRSPGFDLLQNVEKAIKDGHPYPEKLHEYANRIGEVEK